MYSILIPIHNEIGVIRTLLKKLFSYSIDGHEIIIINDGSNDGTEIILNEYNFIKIVTNKINRGKGYAIKKGLKFVTFNKIIIFDGDLELCPEEISKLMILDKNKKIYSTMGYRFNKLNPIKSNFDWGNFMFTSFFNIIFNCHHKDILCCAKSFYLSELKNYAIISNGFSIDVELSSVLSIKNKKIPQIKLKYNRRGVEEGKKLQISDGWGILRQIIKMTRHY